MKSYKISSYTHFINESKQSKQSKEDIDFICKKYGIKNYTINEDGSVDVDGDVVINYTKLTRLPLKFGKVTGFFDCYHNNLYSLEGSPYEVGEYFKCSYNQRLKSLKGGPVKVNGSFHCDSNKLTSFEGAPKEVGGNFLCSFNQLTSLEGCTKKVDYFDCSYNQLTSLEDSPSVSIGFNCQYNELTSLKGAPEIVGGNFWCSGNKLRDVKFFPIVSDNIFMTANPVEEIFKLFPEERWKEVAEYLNEYNVIRDGNKVILQALEVVYDELGIEIPDDIYIEGYEII